MQLLALSEYSIKCEQQREKLTGWQNDAEKNRLETIREFSAYKIIIPNELVDIFNYVKTFQG